MIEETGNVMVADGPEAEVKSAPQPTDQEKYDRLTERERSVLRFIARGYSAPEIGERLLISPKTVDTYKQRIQEKIHLNHRSQYVQFAFRLGLLAGE